jgi:hypothetical protein
LQTAVRKVVRRGALAALIVGVAGVAVSLHRNGHTQGDDFALYLRQARSIFDGDISQVVADNRFAVNNSAGGFSPIAYPWVWPLLLSPFVKFWGLDYDALKLLEVAALCTWLVFVHGIVRRRIGRGLALAVTAVVGTAPALLTHTDQLLSEYPHAAAVAVFIWWLDRIRANHRLIEASTRELWIVGALITLTFNIRRETIVLIAVIAAIQFFELLGDRSSLSRSRRRGPWWSVPTLAAWPWRRLAVPYLAFAVTATGFQLLMPSMLFPENGDDPMYIDERIGDYAGWLSRHLGLGWHPLIGAIVMILAVAGIAIGVYRRPGLDGPLALVTVATTLAVSTHFRMVDRYYFQVLPWIIYFATVTVVAVLSTLTSLVSSLIAGTRGRPSHRHRRSRRHGGRSQIPRWVLATAAVPLLFLITVHTIVLPGDIDDAATFNRDGRQQIGPTHPDFVPIFQAVRTYTRTDDVIVYFRARTMTLLTDRRSIQTGRVERVISSADYFAQRRGSDYVQPNFTVAEGERLGLEIVWSDKTWVLWHVPEEVRLEAAREAAARPAAG